MVLLVCNHLSIPLNSVKRKVVVVRVLLFPIIIISRERKIPDYSVINIREKRNMLRENFEFFNVFNILNKNVGYI